MRISDWSSDVCSSDLAWAFGSVWSKGRDLPSPFMGAAAQMLCGGAMMVVAGLLLGERLDAMPTTKGLFAVAYLSGFCSIIAFSAYVWLLHHLRPTLSGRYSYVNPVVAFFLCSLLSSARFIAHSLCS